MICSNMASGKVSLNVLDKPKDVCGHCDNKVTDKGKGSDGICCDYCGFWVHAGCDGMSRDSYTKFKELARQVQNLSYYCSLYHCNVVSKEILKQLGPIRQKVEENSQRITILESDVKKTSLKSWISKLRKKYRTQL